MRAESSESHCMITYLFSCENATCAVPEAHRELFHGEEDVLTSAEGWEPGSLNLAQGLSIKFRTPLIHSDVTRLLIDFECDGDDRWSRFSMKLPETTRNKIAERHERPYRTQLWQRIEGDLKRHATVVHLMVHTHAEADGRILLDTPKDSLLAGKIAAAWLTGMRVKELDVTHSRTIKTSALAAALSRDFPMVQYAQIRVSVSQSFFLEGRPWRWETLKNVLLESLAEAVSAAGPISDPELPLIGLD